MVLEVGDVAISGVSRSVDAKLFVGLQSPGAGVDDAMLV